MLRVFFNFLLIFILILIGLAYKIQKSLHKIDELVLLIPEKRQDDIKNLQESKSFLAVCEDI